MIIGDQGSEGLAALFQYGNEAIPQFGVGEGIVFATVAYFGIITCNQLTES